MARTQGLIIMAKLFEMDDHPEYEKWAASCPKVIQEMIKHHPVNLLYRLTTSNHRCTIHSYSENGTITVDITGQYNKVVFSRTVWGVNPSHLVECDLPTEGEEVGDLCEIYNIEPKDMVEWMKKDNRNNEGSWSS